ncbi:aquaporin-9b [Erpetoichthys calabaricus]|uniref:Aquaporin 9b n=1 Tax=Erpetoichthys calabaricus TaxID=27687 RepID=A0A8C4XGT3_ERPCA|nr:aquaporin-9b [Erpetoichthys calabaricus]
MQQDLRTGQYTGELFSEKQQIQETEDMEAENKSFKKRIAVRSKILREALAEFLGTFILIIFGCGSVAQTVLSSGAFGEMLTIHIGFTIGVIMAVYVAGGISGAHVNPAVSLAMCVTGRLSFLKFPVYVLSQFLGAFTGAAAVYGLYYDAFLNYTGGVLTVTGPNASAQIFATYPATYLSIFNGFMDQVVSTGALVLCIFAITDKKNNGAPKGMEPLLIGLIIMVIGVSMGLNCGYPINPARDLGPRLFTFIAGWGVEVFSAGNNWWWVPVAGPMVGGIVGALIYVAFIELHHHDPQKQSEEDHNVQDKYEMITMN